MFKDSRNRWLTKSLFLETRDNDATYPALYTLSTRGHQLPCLGEIYVDLEDIEEHEFANAHLGGWEHWQVLKNKEWFEPYYNMWRSELEAKLKSKAFSALNDMVAAGGATGLAAAKWLAEEGWKSKKRGRPSKAEVDAERRRQASVSAEDEDDATRVGLRVVNGSK